MSRSKKRRGLTLLELMIALIVTAIISGAIASMMSAVSIGVRTRRDSRRTIIASAGAAQRLAAYVSPSRAILDANSSSSIITLWAHDDRASETVHATEIRWLVLSEDDEVELWFVEFPTDWTDTQKDLADLEYASSMNWDTVLATYQAAGHAASYVLAEDVTSMTVVMTDKSALDARHIEFLIDFATSEETITLSCAGTILLHEPPEA